MARGWLSVALMAAWLGGCSLAGAQQPLPGPGSYPPPGGIAPPGAMAPPMMPGYAPPPPMFPGPPGPHCPPVEPCDAPVDTSQFSLPVFHIGFDYLLWYTRKSTLPVLVTTGSLADSIPGGLGQPNTRVLADNGNLQDTRQQGGRVTFGVGVDSSNEWSLFASFFALEQSTVGRTFGSSGTLDSQVLARPFFDTVNRIENADPVALPGIMAGTISVNSQQRFYGGDIDLRYEYVSGENSRIHFLGGVKLLWLEDAVTITTTSVDVPGMGVPGNAYLQNEDISVYNRFYGGQFGAMYEFRLGPVFLQATGKLALGVTDINPRLKATSRIIEPNGLVTTASDRALYVSPNNAGNFNQTKFAFAPEGALRLGIDFNEYVRVSVGYNYLYISEVGRAGESLSRNVNIQPIGVPTFTPTAPAETSLRTTYFWAQGLDVSVRFSF